MNKGDIQLQAKNTLKFPGQSIQGDPWRHLPMFHAIESKTYDPGIVTIGSQGRQLVEISLDVVTESLSALADEMARLTAHWLVARTCTLARRLYTGLGGERSTRRNNLVDGEETQPEDLLEEDRSQ